MLKKQLPLILFGLSLAACAPVGEDAAVQLADNTSSTVGCKAVDSYFFNALSDLPLKGQQFPSEELVERALREKLELDLETGRIKADAQAVEKFIALYLEMYRLGAQKVPEKLGLNEPQEILSALSALELGDQTTPEKQQLRQEWERLQKPLIQAAQALQGECEEPAPDPQDPVVDPVQTPLMEYLEKTYAAPVFGGMKTVAVAYQSCEVLNLEPMNSNSPSVVGVEVYGRHSNGSGNLRRVASLSDVIRTHYYIKNQVAPSSSCADLKQEPLIYDYGGKPGASSSMDSPLDFFRNAGTGGPGLGTDCSGYVFTAYATAGLKMRSDQPLKALQVFGISAGMMKNPSGNGLNCLEKTYGDLKPGDIIASSGHVVMVDEVGPDPFGVAHIGSASECTTSRMSHERFDFVISQSSPSKGAIGINRMLASDYFATSTTMREGLKDYAVSACLKRFGQSRAATTTRVSVVRHKGTSACKTRPVELVKQDCLASCRVTEIPTP